MPPKTYIPIGNVKLPSTYKSRSTTAYGEDYITSQYDVNVPYSKSKSEYRANRQTFWDSAVNATGRGGLGALIAVGETVAVLTDWEGIYNRVTGKEDDFNNFLMKGADEARKWEQEVMPEYSSNKFGDKGWWMNGYSSVLESAGYFAVGGAVGEVFGLAGRAVGLSARPLQLVQGVGTAITMNYTEGVQIAHQSYNNMIQQGIAPEIAADKASKLIDANRLNILFELPQYLSMFRVGGAYNYSRQFKNIDKGFKSTLANLAGQGLAEGSEEVIQGYMQSELERDGRLENATNILNDPNSTKAQKERAKQTLASENLNTTAETRFFDYITSEEGLTEAIFGAFGGIMFEGLANTKDIIRRKGGSESQAEAAAREVIANNPTTLNNLLRKNDQIDKDLDEAIQKGDPLERDRLVKQKFINLAIMNATKGTYSQFMRTIEGLSTMTDEEIQEFGVDKEYLKKMAPDMLKDAKFIESIYNDTLRNFSQLPAQTPEQTDAKSKIVASAMDLKWQFREFENFKKKASNDKNNLYTEHVSTDERQIVELKHQIEAYEILSQDKNIKELLQAKTKLKELRRTLFDSIKSYNQINGTDKGLDDFNNPVVDQAGIQLTASEIAYETQKEFARSQYNKLVKDQQKTFEEVVEITQKVAEKAAETKQTAQQEAETIKRKAEQEDIVNRTKMKQYSDLIRQNSANPKTLEEIKAQIDQEEVGPQFNKTDKADLKRVIDTYLNPQQEEDLPEESRGEGRDLNDLVRETAQRNKESEQEVHDKNSDLTGNEAYNPLPQEFEKDTEAFEEELDKEFEEGVKPNPGASVTALATDLMISHQRKDGSYIHTGEVNPTANPKMFDPDFIKPGDKLIIFVDKEYVDYEKFKDDVNEIPLAVVREVDYNEGNREPIAYIHTSKWYQFNENIEESLRQDLAEQTRFLRNTMFQTKDENGNFLPHITTVIDKSNGVITKSDKEHSIFEVTDNPKLVVANSSETFVGIDSEEMDRLNIKLTHSLEDKNKNPLIGVPFLLVKSPSGKYFPKFVKTHKLSETTQGQKIAETIYHILDEYFNNLAESQALKEAGIKNFMDVAEQIKKFVYFGDKTQNLDQRKLFFATEDGKVNLQGKEYDFSQETNKEAFIRALQELYSTVNTKHLNPKEAPKFRYLMWENGKFTKHYQPYVKFLDQMEFISINSKPNNGTIFGNYVTKIDNNIKPIDQKIEEKPTVPTEPNEITDQKVAETKGKPYIEGTKKSPFKRATSKKNVSNQDGINKKKECD